MNRLLDALNDFLTYHWGAHATIWYAGAVVWLLMLLLCLRRPRKMR